MLESFFLNRGSAGRPFGPVFLLCLQALVDQISELRPVYQKWYMDDGGIIGTPDLLLKVWEILKFGGEPLGLHLNPQKCEWLWLDPNSMPHCGVPVTPTSNSNAWCFSWFY